MYVYELCKVLNEIGIPPDTVIHLVPFDSKFKYMFCFEDFEIPVIYNAETCRLKDIVNDNEFYNVEKYLLKHITILGDCILIDYVKEK